MNNPSKILTRPPIKQYIDYQMKRYQRNNLTPIVYGTQSNIPTSS